MPSYDLACGACGTEFEAFRQGFLRDEDRVCPECGVPVVACTGELVSGQWRGDGTGGFRQARGRQ